MPSARRTPAVTAQADSDSMALETAWAFWEQGRPALAADAMLRLLQARSAAGDRVAELCANLLQHDPAPVLADGQADSLLAGAMAELITLAEQQDAQIAALLALTSPC